MQQILALEIGFWPLVSVLVVLMVALAAWLQSTRQRKTLGQQLELSQALVQQQQIDLALAEQALEQQEQAHNQQASLLEQSRQQLDTELKALMLKVFDANSEKFQQSSQQVLQQQLGPLSQSLQGLQQHLQQGFKQQGETVSLFSGQLKQLNQMNQQLSREANDLAKALSGDNKQQGNWGELVLENLLELSGLQAERDYHTQSSFTDEDGRRKQPDMLIKLPNQRFIIIDAKLSLKAYMGINAGEAGSDKAFIDSTKRHIQGLSGKQYQNLAQLESPEFVFLFIPIEASFAWLMQHAPELLDYAYQRQIVLVSPSNLLAALKLVQQFWQLDKQNRHGQEMAEQAGKLHDQFVLVLESLNQMQTHMDKAQGSYQQALERLSSGRGNAVRRSQQLVELGAKNQRQLPENFKAELAEQEAD